MGILYLHLGLHKTATSSLQKQIFPNIEGVQYLQRNLSKKDSLYKKIINYCFLPRENIELLETIRHDVSVYLSKTDLLLSEEWFTSDYTPFSQFEGTPWQVRLKRLSKIADGYKSKILLTIRHPETGLFSYYCEMCTVGGLKKWPTFEIYLKNSNDADCYDVHNLLKFMEPLFCCQITYVKFELLKESGIKFVSEILDFLDRQNTDIRSIEDSNIKKKNDHGTVVRPITNITKLFTYLITRTPSFFKTNFLKSFSEVVLRWLYQRRPVVIIPTPDELLKKEITARFSKTIERFYND